MSTYNEKKASVVAPVQFWYTGWVVPSFQFVTAPERKSGPATTIPPAFNPLNVTHAKKPSRSEEVDQKLEENREEDAMMIDNDITRGESISDREENLLNRRAEAVAARRKRNPPAFEVRLSQAAICAAAMPVQYTSESSNGGENNVIVAGGAHNFLSLLLPQ